MGRVVHGKGQVAVFYRKTELPCAHVWRRMESKRESSSARHANASSRLRDNQKQRTKIITNTYHIKLGGCRSHSQPPHLHLRCCCCSPLISPLIIFSLKQAEKVPAHVVHPEAAGVIEPLDRLLAPRAPRPVAHKPQPQGERKVHSDATATATVTATVGRHRRISISTSVRRNYGRVPVVVCVEGGRWWLNSRRREGPRARARGLQEIRR